MGRKRVNRTPEETKKLRQEYYQFHREEILKRAKERRQNNTAPNPKVKTETALQSLLNEWCGQLSSKLQENLPQWLEIGLQRQIEIIKAMLTNQ